MYLNDRSGLLRRIAIAPAILVMYAIFVCLFLLVLGVWDPLIWNMRCHRTTAVLVDTSYDNNKSGCVDIMGHILYDNYNGTILLASHVCEVSNSTNTFNLTMYFPVYYQPDRPENIFLKLMDTSELLIAFGFSGIVPLLALIPWIYTEVHHQRPKMSDIEDPQKGNDITF